MLYAFCERHRVSLDGRTRRDENMGPWRISEQEAGKPSVYSALSLRQMTAIDSPRTYLPPSAHLQEVGTLVLVSVGFPGAAAGQVKK